MCTYELYVAEDGCKDPACYYSDSDTFEENVFYGLDPISAFKMCCDTYAPGTYCVSLVSVIDNELVEEEQTVVVVDWDGMEAKDYLASVCDALSHACDGLTNVKTNK